ncbi:MAG: hypothetical protein EPN99_09590 [Frankiales bacterium]|nr:MAG: hypothetical protein EPN99_09590 [Frankiales bacterium]
MSYPPLGSYSQFRGSTGGPFPWGEGGRSSIAYGVDVLPDLIRGIRSLPELAAQTARKAEPRAAVLACVYVLSSPEVVDALLPLESCVVVDRQQNRLEEVQRLQANGQPLSTLHLPGFDEIRLPNEDGSVPVIGPGTPLREPVALGPVRAAGWRRSTARRDPRPYVHVKMLVGGRTWVWEDDWGQEGYHFTPLITWMGSANWTKSAPSHLEFGLWSDDRALLDRNTSFLLDVVRFSQPLSSVTAGPEPELVDALWDDAAFADYYAEYGPWPDDDDDDPDL